ncbi:MAG: hypothetical protein AAF212_10115 [Verrucomicrobiota bacterium]
MISHKNVWHNIRDIFVSGQRYAFSKRFGDDATRRLFDLDDPSNRVVGVSWLPQYHDTGESLS